MTLVAVDEKDAIVGFAAAIFLDEHPSGFDTYLGALYLLPEMKRRGIGTRLLRTLARKLANAGRGNMILRTLRLAASRHFYERHGARFIPEGIEIDAGHFDDVVYAFDDLTALAAPEISAAAERSGRDRKTRGTSGLSPRSGGAKE